MIRRALGFVNELTTRLIGIIVILPLNTVFIAARRPAMIPRIASPHPITRRRFRVRLALLALLALLTVLALLPAGAWAVGPAAVLPKPANIACQGWERDTVVVSWKDTATDESNYRIERKIGGGAFSEVATITP